MGSKTLKKDGCYGIDFENVTFNYTRRRKRRAHFCKPALGAGNGQRLCRPVRGWKDTTAVQLLEAILGHHRRNHQNRWSTNYRPENGKSDGFDGFPSFRMFFFWKIPYWKISVWEPMPAKKKCGKQQGQHRLTISLWACRKAIRRGLARRGA